MEKKKSLLFLLGGLLMVVGTGCFVLMVEQKVFCWVYLVGALIFACIQSSQIYTGDNFVVRRLKRIMNVADLLFVLAGILMADTAHHFLQPLFGMDGYLNYIQFAYNKWVILLLVAALLELYTTHRIASELKKEGQ